MSRPLGTVLLVCALLSIGCEVASAWMFRHLAANRSVIQETNDALHLTSSPGARHSVLIVGNSLVLHGIDLHALAATAGPDYLTRKEAIVGSGYEDWLYGVRSLLDRGSHPDMIVLGMSPAALVQERTPVGRSTHLVWTTRNLERYAVDHELGLTETSNLVLQHFSAFFALRDQLRQDSRKAIVPGYAAMSHDFFDQAPIATSAAVDVPLAASRLAVMDSLCAARGVRFAFLLIPTRAPDDIRMEAMVVDAGKRAGVPVLIPLPNRDLPASDQLDGYHLNPTGAVAFSSLAGSALRETLGAPAHELGHTTALIRN
jgi:hypothetical protein